MNEAEVKKLIHQAVREELQAHLDMINNFKPDPNAPSFGSASGAMERGGLKQYLERRIKELAEEKASE